MKELYELRDVLCKELSEYGKKGELSAGSLSTIDTLAHSIKNIDKILDADGDYSGYYPYMGRSYARGNVRRDSMGRYSGERGYSRTNIADKMRELMDEAPDDRTRQEIHRLVEKLEN